MKKQTKVFFFLLLSIATHSIAQPFPTIQPKDITIIRDTFGVPHIFANTDAEVAYGLAWANAEDAFLETQNLVYTAKGYMGRAKGVEGAKADFFVHAIAARQLVNQQFDTALSPAFKKYINGFVQGLNAYAAAHPEKVTVKKAFPVSDKDIVTAYVVILSFLTGAQGPVADALSGKFDQQTVDFTTPFKNIGSNAYAISPAKSTDGKTYLCINPHLHMEGLLSFYEAHLQSNEGLTFTGATFQGAASHAMGTNKHLGWGFTWNYFDKLDVYRLKMIDAKKLTYEFDGKTMKLEKRPVWLKVKIKGMVIPVRKMTYWSVYGATLKSDKSANFYAIRFPTNQSIKGGQELYEMAKAETYESCWQAMRNNHTIPLFNMVYADDKNNIFYLSHGTLPDRKHQEYNWSKILPGNTSKTLWTSLVAVDAMPHVINPACGYVYNTNNDSYSATCDGENDNPQRLPSYANERPFNNNRAETLKSFFKENDRISFQQFKDKKFDWKIFPTSNFMTSLQPLWTIDENKYPAIKDFLAKIKGWDRVCDTNSYSVAAFGAFIQRVWDKRHYGDKEFGSGFPLTEEEVVAFATDAQQDMVTHFGGINIRWGDIHRLRRGDKSIAVNGFPDLLSPEYPKLRKHGEKYELNPEYGDTYTMFVQYGKDGAESIESLQPLGNAIDPASPYNKDQMENFVHIHLKKHSFDKNYWLQHASKIYPPQ